jgi:predicted ABC-type ATPase
MDVNPGSSHQPTLGIVAGPNGSGKTSFYEKFLSGQFTRWVNADKVALTLAEASESERNLTAAKLAEEERHRLLANGITFAFETVFSRTDHWMGFLHRAKGLGYRLELFFICTSDPVLNAARVRTRMGRGGHAVPLDKVVSRYPGSIRTALQASKIVDGLRLYDNTEWDYTPLLLGWWEDQQPKYVAESIPRWAAPFFRRPAKAT